MKLFKWAERVMITKRTTQPKSVIFVERARSEHMKQLWKTLVKVEESYLHHLRMQKSFDDKKSSDSCNGRDAPKKSPKSSKSQRRTKEIDDAKGTTRSNDLKKSEDPNLSM